MFFLKKNNIICLRVIRHANMHYIHELNRLGAFRCPKYSNYYFERNLLIYLR